MVIILRLKITQNLMLLLTVILIKKVIFLMKKISRTLDDIALEQINKIEADKLKKTLNKI